MGKPAMCGAKIKEESTVTNPEGVGTIHLAFRPAMIYASRVTTTSPEA